MNVRCASTLAVLVVGLGTGCSDSTSTPTPSVASTVDAGDSGACVPAEAGATTAVHRGIVVDYSLRAPVAGATVAMGEGRMATTDANGAFAVTVPIGTPYTMTIGATGFATVGFGEVKLSGDWDQGTFVLSSLEHSRLARGYFTDYDPTKGVLLVSIGKIATCASIEGTTIAFEPAGTAMVKYFRNYMQTMATTAGAGEEPAAVAWNIEPGKPVSIRLTSPSCTQAMGPVTDGTVTHSATVTTTAGGDIYANGPLSISYVRAHLK